MKERDVRSLAKEFIFRGQKLRGTVVETHISWVILTSRYAFKIKKPLRLSFLDFSSQSLRKKYCEKELLLNRRFSDIYIEVAPLRWTPTTWAFGGSEGKIMDFAVVMKRMQSAKRMDMLLSGSKVAEPSIVRLARMVAVNHAKAEVIASSFDGPALRQAFNDIGVIRPFVASSLGRQYDQLISKAIRWSDAFIRKNSDRFARRVSMGYKRDLHGDLHSGNIFLYTKPVIFDCIEFNDDFRRIDVLDEVAFICMDLESFEKSKLARTFLNTYLERCPVMETASDHAIYGYFKCYRANVRAKVHAIAAEQEEVSSEKRKHLLRSARYLALIRRYLREAPPVPSS